ncbi:tetratricopeptide repeat protein [Limnothrix redekei]|uniref:Tetratricopeptide repeat protein n=1 Tax=Limnothrix redekei LRLZ20PSL1 TaxID=3112953 RepID=A0ABW7CAF9_9CYAN
MGDRVEQSHSGPGDNVAGDKNITVQPTSQQGIVGNDSTTINIQTVEQRFEAKTLEPTIDGPPNNLKVYGLTRDRFVGRDADLARLDELLQTQTQVAIAGVSGLGGVGKSELALQYAREHLGDYPGGVVWLRAAAACGELVAFAQPRWFAQEDLTHLDTPEKQAAFCQAHWPKTADDPPGRVLLILDDVTDFADQVKGFPVVGDRFRVLFTSRERWLDQRSRLDLGVLEPPDALTLLSNFVGQDRIAAEQATAEKLCEWLGYLPLGLELVGSYLAADPELSLAKMQQRLDQKRLAAKALTQVPATTTAERGVAAAFELSWQALSQEAQRLAVLLGCFGAAPVLWAWVQGCLPNDDEEELEAARAELVRLSLLERLGDGQYGLHPLIREFFAAQRAGWPEGGALQQAFLGQMVSVAKTVPSTVTLADLARTRPAWPHLATAAAASNEIADEDSIGPFVALAWLAEGQGLWDKAEQYYSDCLSVTESRFGTDHPATANILNNLAVLYKSQGRYKVAELLHQQSLEIKEQVLGADHPHTATSLNNLANLYESQGRYEAAESLYRRSLGIDEKVYGPDHPVVATSLNNLAGLYQLQGQYEAAEPLLQRSLEIWEQVLGSNHTHTATCLNNLANLYLSQKKYEAAEPLLRRSLEIWGQVLRTNHTHTATCLNNLAGLYQLQGRYEAAEPLLQRSLEIWEQVLGTDHPNTATCLNNLANLYYSQGRYEAAEPLYRRSLEIRERLLEANHPDTAISQGNLGQLYMALERYSEAESLLLLAFKTFQGALNSDHPYVKETVRRLNVLVQTVIEADRAADLSDHPLTQAILQQLTTPPEIP